MRIFTQLDGTKRSIFSDIICIRAYGRGYLIDYICGNRVKEFESQVFSIDPTFISFDAVIEAIGCVNKYFTKTKVAVNPKYIYDIVENSIGTLIRFAHCSSRGSVLVADDFRGVCKRVYYLRGNAEKVTGYEANITRTIKNIGK